MVKCLFLGAPVKNTRNVLKSQIVLKGQSVIYIL
jgi:hypothetical protein